MPETREQKSQPYVPTVRGRRLASEIRNLRTETGLTPEEAAARLPFSRPKLVGIETAKLPPSVRDTTSILDAYGPSNQTLRLALIQLTQEIRQKGWWVSFGDILDDSFAELEVAASEIWSYVIHLVPGLLQTPAYALSLIKMGTDSGALIERRLEARMTRQVILGRANPPRLTFLLEEHALHLAVGDREVMREQLLHLLAMGRRANMTIRIIPGESGVHPAVGGGPFSVFRFPSQIEGDVAYLEQVTGGLYEERDDQVAHYRTTAQRVAEMALNEQESAALIAALTKEQTST